MIHYDQRVDHNESYIYWEFYIILITSWKDLIIINMQSIFIDYLDLFDEEMLG
jgi:hypothetical protein